MGWPDRPLGFRLPCHESPLRLSVGSLEFFGSFAEGSPAAVVVVAAAAAGWFAGSFAGFPWLRASRPVAEKQRPAVMRWFLAAVVVAAAAATAVAVAVIVVVAAVVTAVAAVIADVAAIVVAFAIVAAAAAVAGSCTYSSTSGGPSGLMLVA